MPFQANDDVGPSDGLKFTLKIQRVIPITLNEDWNVLSRTILPVIDQEGTNDELGLETPDGGPEWGLRFGVTFLFPK